MTVKTVAALKAQFQGRDPADHNADLVDTVTAIKLMSFDGVAAAGPCTATGLVVGDVVVSVIGVTSGALGDASAAFESVITVADQIQQISASNLSANDYIALIRSAA